MSLVDRGLQRRLVLYYNQGERVVLGKVGVFILQVGSC